jgi:chromosomal replication initiation ATPase DnaA
MSYSERNALLDAVAFSWGVTTGDILGRSRLRKHVEARRAVAAAMVARGLEYAFVGRLLGRHHTTILHLLGRRPSRLPRYLEPVR